MKALSHLVHTLAEYVTTIETLHIHTADLTAAHEDSNLAQDRFDLQSMFESIARLPRLRELSLKACNLGFCLQHLWPSRTFNACSAIVCMHTTVHSSGFVVPDDVNNSALLLCKECAQQRASERHMHAAHADVHAINAGSSEHACSSAQTRMRNRNRLGQRGHALDACEQHIWASSSAHESGRGGRNASNNISVRSPRRLRRGAQSDCGTHHVVGCGKSSRIFRNRKCLERLEVFDLSDNGLEERQLPALLAMFLGVHITGHARSSDLNEGSSGSLGGRWSTRASNFRSWCELDLHLKPCGYGGDVEQCVVWGGSKKSCVECGVRVVRGGNGAVEAGTMQSMHACGRALGAVESLEKLNLSGNLFSAVGEQQLRSGLEGSSTVECQFDGS